MPGGKLLTRDAEQTTTRARSGAMSMSAPPTSLQSKAGNQVMIGGHRPAVQGPEVTEATATSAFAKVAPFIDFVVPTAGSSGAVDFELRIPIKGGMVGIHVAGSAARVNETSVKLAVEANVTGGASVGVAHATFELGAYLEVQGSNSSSALTIVSWVLYRQLAESNAPREIGNAWFGSKKNGAAPQYDAAVRKVHFAKDSGNWAEIGVQAAGSVKGAIASVKGSAGIKGRAGRVYDPESIERRASGMSLTQRFTSLFGSKRGAQASLGDRIFTVIGSASIDATVAGGDLTVTIALRQVKDKRKGSESTSYKLDSLLVDGTAHCKGLAALASATGGTEALVDLLSKVVKATNTATERAEKQLQEESRAAKAGDVVGELDSVRDGLATASDKLSTGLNFSIPDITASGQIHVIGGLERGKTTLKVLFEKMTKLAMDVGVVAGSITKTERLASIEYDDGTWTAHLGSLSKELSSKSGARPKSGSWLPATPSGQDGKGDGQGQGKAKGKGK